MKKNEDQIIYVAGKRVGFDKDKLQTGIDLDEHYNTVYPYVKPKITKDVINPADVLKEIRAKLSPLELLVLKTYGI
jgi:hypothetical protein